MKNGNVAIDGKSFTGRNVVINGDQVIVDGEVQSGSLVGKITVTVHGDVEQLTTTYGDVNATTVSNIKTVSGDVDCPKILGEVNTISGDIG